MIGFSFEALAYVGAFVTAYFIAPCLMNIARAGLHRVTKWSGK